MCTPLIIRMVTAAAVNEQVVASGPLAALANAVLRAYPATFWSKLVPLHRQGVCPRAPAVAWATVHLCRVPSQKQNGS